MDLVILFIVIAVSFIAGWIARERHAMHVVNKLLEQHEAEQEELTEDRTKMRLEKHNEMIYAFVVENDEFIAQGKDLTELDKAIQARFPGRKFSIQEQNLKDLEVEYHEPV